MVKLQWVDPGFAAQQVLQAMTYDLRDNPMYKHSAAWKPALATLVAFICGLSILAYPPKHRKLSIALLAIPVTYAFLHQSDLSASSPLNDTYGRFLYIWFANMSYEVTILEFTPAIFKENDGWKRRVSAAYKVLFARAHAEFTTKPSPTAKIAKHNFSKSEFLLRHAWKASYLFVLQAMYTTFSDLYLTFDGPVYGRDKAIFFRRLPASLNVDELWDRFDLTVHWCIMNMFMYECYHSSFAVLFVGLGLDSPSDWSMTLFGSVWEAWSVRRYWGKHWHDYIYHSFSGHTKIVTRQWLAMERGLLRRLIENTIVFTISGIMHSAVRYAQYGSTGDCWVITFWYIGQMVPIVIEGLVQDLWARGKQELGINNSKWLGRAEKWLGYTWVLGFNMWSVSKYVHTRDDWADQAWRKKHAKELAEWDARNRTKDASGMMRMGIGERGEL